MSNLFESASSQLVGIMSPVVKALVLLPETVEIEVREKNDTIFFSLSVDPSDRGRIIGKQGKILQSLRLLFQSIATLHGRNAVVEIIEWDQRTPEPLGSHQRGPVRKRTIEHVSDVVTSEKNVR